MAIAPHGRTATNGGRPCGASAAGSIPAGVKTSARKHQENWPTIVEHVMMERAVEVIPALRELGWLVREGRRAGQ